MAQAKRQRRLFTPAEAQQVTQDKQSCLKALESPHIEDKSAVRAAYKRLEKMQEIHGIPDLTPDQRTKAAVQVKELEEQIKVGMLSYEEMRRNPPGAVDQNVWWEKKNKSRIMKRRNLLLALHKGMPGDEAQELTTIERLRPRTNQLNMDGAQIPAVRSFSFPSDAFRDNYDTIFGKSAAAAEPAADVDFAEEEEIQGDLLEDDDDTPAVLQELVKKRR